MQIHVFLSLTNGEMATKRQLDTPESSNSNILSLSLVLNYFKQHYSHQTFNSAEFLALLNCNSPESAKEEAKRQMTQILESPDHDVNSTVSTPSPTAWLNTIRNSSNSPTSSAGKSSTIENIWAIWSDIVYDILTEDNNGDIHAYRIWEYSASTVIWIQTSETIT
ncbi:unnamed protein product [Mucor hiemalis]